MCYSQYIHNWLDKLSNRILDGHSLFSANYYFAFYYQAFQSFPIFVCFVHIQYLTDHFIFIHTKLKYFMFCLYHCSLICFSLRILKASAIILSGGRESYDSDVSFPTKEMATSMNSYSQLSQETLSSAKSYLGSLMSLRSKSRMIKDGLFVRKSINKALRILSTMS